MTQEINSQFQASEIEITYRNKTPYHERVHVDASRIADKLFRSIWNSGKIELVEQFKIMLLDNRCNCLGISHISSGGINYCFADPKLIFGTALKAHASKLILAHNHPSGITYPSEADKAMTTRIIEGAKLLELSVLDHLILTRDGYYSFADNGLIPGLDHTGARHPSPLPG